MIVVKNMINNVVNKTRKVKLLLRLLEKRKDKWKELLTESAQQTPENSGTEKRVRRRKLLEKIDIVWLVWP